MLLCCHRYVTADLKSGGLFLSPELVVSFFSPLFPFPPSFPHPSFLPFSSAVKWTCLLLRGRVARLPVVVRLLCMNQRGDRAAGRMADATARKLFNQAALPSCCQGETLHRWMKKKDPEPHGHSHSLAHAYMCEHTCAQTYFNPAH